MVSTLPWAEVPEMIKNRNSYLFARIRLSLLPDCGCNVSHCFSFLLQWLPTTLDLVTWLPTTLDLLLQLWATGHPSFQYLAHARCSVTASGEVPDIPTSSSSDESSSETNIEHRSIYIHPAEDRKREDRATDPDMAPETAQTLASPWPQVAAWPLVSPWLQW